jgi:hypothetical protein
MLILKDMLSVSSLWVVVSDISYMFLQKEL